MNSRERRCFGALYKEQEIQYRASHFFFFASVTTVSICWVIKRQRRVVSLSFNRCVEKGLWVVGTNHAGTKKGTAELPYIFKDVGVTSSFALSHLICLLVKSLSNPLKNQTASLCIFPATLSFKVLQSSCNPQYTSAEKSSTETSKICFQVSLFRIRHLFNKESMT